VQAHTERDQQRCSRSAQYKTSRMSGPHSSSDRANHDAAATDLRSPGHRWPTSARGAISRRSYCRRAQGNRTEMGRGSRRSRLPCLSVRSPAFRRLGARSQRDFDEPAARVRTCRWTDDDVKRVGAAVESGVAAGQKSSGCPNRISGETSGQRDYPSAIPPVLRLERHQVNRGGFPCGTQCTT
jgi:hypothetical protein